MRSFFFDFLSTPRDIMSNKNNTEHTCHCVCVCALNSQFIYFEHVTFAPILPVARKITIHWQYKKRMHVIRHTHNYEFNICQQIGWYILLKYTFCIIYLNGRLYTTHNTHINKQIAHRNTVWTSDILTRLCWILVST